MSGMPGERDELEEYLAQAMGDADFRAAYERASRRPADPFSAMGEAMGTVGVWALGLAERLRDFTTGKRRGR